MQKKGICSIASRLPSAPDASRDKTRQTTTVRIMPGFVTCACWDYGVSYTPFLSPSELTCFYLYLLTAHGHLLLLQSLKKKKRKKEMAEIYVFEEGP